MRRVVIGFVGLLIAWLGLPALTSTAHAAPVQVYAYELQQHPASELGDTTERGPPLTANDYTADDAVDLRSHGASARLHVSQTSAISTYSDVATLAEVAPDTTATGGHVVLADGVLLSHQRCHVAANGAGRVDRLLASSAQEGRTAGVLELDGELIPLVSGKGSMGNYAASGHVEGQAALIMRERGLTSGTLYIDNPNGICGYCTVARQDLWQGRLVSP